MPKVALFVRLEAKKGKEAEVEKLIKGCLSIAENEPATVSWYALRLGPTTFGIFDTFADEKGRQAHLAGEVAKKLMAKTPDLFTANPVIERVDVLASKVPEMEHH